MTYLWLTRIASLLVLSPMTITSLLVKLLTICLERKSEEKTSNVLMLSLALKEEETMDQEEEELQEEKDVSSVDKMGILLVNVLTLKEKEILEVLPETILIQEVREITEEAIVSRATQNLNLMRALLEESL